MAQHDRKVSIPESEEVFSLAGVKGLSHLLDATLGILAETSLQLPIHVLHDLVI